MRIHISALFESISCFYSAWIPSIEPREVRTLHFPYDLFPSHIDCTFVAVRDGHLSAAGSFQLAVLLAENAGQTVPRLDTGL